VLGDAVEEGRLVPSEVGGSVIFGRLQALVEAVEASLPEPAVRLEPFDGLLERCPLQT